MNHDIHSCPKAIYKGLSYNRLDSNIGTQEKEEEEKKTRTKRESETVRAFKPLLSLISSVHGRCKK